MKAEARSDRFAITDKPTDEEIALITRELSEHNQEQTHGKFDYPDFELELAIKAADGSIVGGINVSSVLGVMFLEVLWIAEKSGCVAAGTWTFSWQGPEFYPRAGYQLIGIYDGYPLGITEHVLMKPLSTANRTDHDEPSDFTIVGRPTKDQMRVVYDGFR